MNTTSHIIFLILMISGSVLAVKRGEDKIEDLNRIGFNPNSAQNQGVDPFKPLVRTNPKGLRLNHHSSNIDGGSQRQDSLAPHTVGFNPNGAINIFNIDPLNKDSVRRPIFKPVQTDHESIRRLLQDPSKIAVTDKNPLKTTYIPNIKFASNPGFSNQASEPITFNGIRELPNSVQTNVQISPRTESQELNRFYNKPGTIKFKQGANEIPFERYISKTPNQQPLINQVENSSSIDQSINQPFSQSTFVDANYRGATTQTDDLIKPIISNRRPIFEYNKKPTEFIQNLKLDVGRTGQFNSGTKNLPLIDTAAVQRILLSLDQINSSKAMNSPYIGADIKHAFDSLSKNARLFIKALDGSENFPAHFERFISAFKAYLGSLSVKEITDEISTSYKVKYDVPKYDKLVQQIDNLEINIIDECKKEQTSALKSQSCLGLAKSIAELFKAIRNIEKISQDEHINGELNSKCYTVQDENLEFLTLEYLRTKVSEQLRSILSSNHNLKVHLGASKFYTPTSNFLKSLDVTIVKSGSKSFLEWASKLFEGLEAKIALFHQFSVKGQSVTKYIRISEDDRNSFVTFIRRVIFDLNLQNTPQNKDTSNIYHSITSGLKDLINVLNNAYNCHSENYFYELIQGEDVCSQLSNIKQNQLPGSLNVKRAEKIVNYANTAIQSLKKSDKFNMSLWLSSLVDLLAFNNELIKRIPNEIDNFDYTIDFVKSSITLANNMTPHNEAYDSHQVTYNTYKIIPVDNFKQNLELIGAKLESFVSRNPDAGSDVNVQLLAKELNNLKNWVNNLVNENNKYYEINDKQNVEFVLPQYMRNDQSQKLIKAHPERNPVYIHNNLNTLKDLINRLTTKVKHVVITNLYRITIPAFQIFIKFYNSGAYSEEDVKKFDEITKGFSDVVNTMKSTRTTVNNGPQAKEVIHNEFDPDMVNDLISKLRELKRYGREKWNSDLNKNPEAANLINSLNGLENFLTNLKAENGKLVEYSSEEDMAPMGVIDTSSLNQSTNSLSRGKKKTGRIFDPKLISVTKGVLPPSINNAAIRKDSDLIEDSDQSVVITNFKPKTQLENFDSFSSSSNRSKPKSAFDKNPSESINHTLNRSPSSVSDSKSEPKSILLNEKSNLKVNDISGISLEREESVPEYKTSRLSNQSFEDVNSNNNPKLEKKKKFDFSQLSPSLSNENSFHSFELESRARPQDVIQTISSFDSSLSGINMVGKRSNAGPDSDHSFDKNMRRGVIQRNPNNIIRLMDQNPSINDLNNNKEHSQLSSLDKSHMDVSRSPLSNSQRKISQNPRDISNELIDSSDHFNYDKSVMTQSPKFGNGILDTSVIPNNVETSMISKGDQSMLENLRNDFSFTHSPENDHKNPMTQKIKRISKKPSQKNSPNDTSNHSSSLSSDHSRIAEFNLLSPLNQSSSLSRQSSEDSLNQYNRNKRNGPKSKDILGEDIDEEEPSQMSPNKSSVGKLGELVNKSNLVTPLNENVNSDEKEISFSFQDKDLGVIDPSNLVNEREFELNNSGESSKFIEDESLLLDSIENSIKPVLFNFNHPKTSPIIDKKEHSADLDEEVSLNYSKSLIESQNSIGDLQNPARNIQNSVVLDNLPNQDDTLNFSFEPEPSFTSSRIPVDNNDSLELSQTSLLKSSPKMIYNPFIEDSYDNDNFSQYYQQPPLNSDQKNHLPSDPNDSFIKSGDISLDYWRKIDLKSKSPIVGGKGDSFTQSIPKIFIHPSNQIRDISEEQEESQYNGSMSNLSGATSQLSRPVDYETEVTIFGDANTPTTNKYSSRQPSGPAVDSTQTQFNELIDKQPKVIAIPEVKEPERKKKRKRVIVFIEHLNCSLCMNDGHLARFVRTVLRIYK